MAKHHADLVFCRKLPGIAIGRLCEKHDGICVICDSYVRPHVLVRICDECNYGSFEVISENVSHFQQRPLSLIIDSSSRDVVLSVDHQEFLMRIIVENARFKRKM